MRVVFAGKEIIIQKTKEICEKGLTTKAKSGIIIKRSKRGFDEDRGTLGERESEEAEDVAACRRRKPTKKLRKTFEKPLDKRNRKWYNNQAPENEGAEIPTGRKPMGERNGFRSLSEDLRKNFKKLFENPLTSERKCGIIYRLSQRDGTERHGDSPDGL